MFNFAKLIGFSAAILLVGACGQMDPNANQDSNNDELAMKFNVPKCTPGEACVTISGQNGECVKKCTTMGCYFADNGADSECGTTHCKTTCVPIDNCIPTETSETTCNDNADNDCDGLADCLDPDCQGLTCDDQDANTCGDTCDSLTCSSVTCAVLGQYVGEFNTREQGQSYNYDYQNHWCTTTGANSDYSYDFDIVRIGTEAFADATMLYECVCISPEIDHILSVHEDCEIDICSNFDQDEQLPIYYVSATPGPGLTEIYRCVQWWPDANHPYQADHFVSTDPGCNGHTLEGPLGFAYAIE